MNSGLEYILMNTNLHGSEQVPWQKRLCAVTVRAGHCPRSLFPCRGFGCCPERTCGLLRFLCAVQEDTMSGVNWGLNCSRCPSVRGELRPDLPLPRVATGEGEKEEKQRRCRGFAGSFVLRGEGLQLKLAGD